MMNKSAETFFVKEENHIFKIKSDEQTEKVCVKGGQRRRILVMSLLEG